ncbi:MAG: hypothetical protein ABIE22_02460 [archaeon]
MVGVTDRDFKGKYEARKYERVFPSKYQGEIVENLKSTIWGEVIGNRVAVVEIDGATYPGTAYFIRADDYDVILQEGLGVVPAPESRDGDKLNGLSVVGLITQGVKENLDELELKLKEFELERFE